MANNLDAILPESGAFKLALAASPNKARNYDTENGILTISGIQGLSNNHGREIHEIHIQALRRMAEKPFFYVNCFEIENGRKMGVLFFDVAGADLVAQSFRLGTKFEQAAP
jgi:hypothetical protein